MQITGSSILALDVGERRIGIAIANKIARLPRPLMTLQNTETVWEDLQAIAVEESVGALVVGLPRGLEGQETRQTEYCRLFGETVAEKLQLPVYYQDEALTSVAAETQLKNAKTKIEKGTIDAYAATIILDDFLSDHPEVKND